MTTVTGTVQNTQQVEGTVLDPARVTAEVLVAIKGEKGDPGEGSGMDGEWTEILLDGTTLNLNQVESEKVKYTCSDSETPTDINYFGTGIPGQLKLIWFDLTYPNQLILHAKMDEDLEGAGIIGVSQGSMVVYDSFTFKEVMYMASCISEQVWELTALGGADANTFAMYTKQEEQIATKENVSTINIENGSVNQIPVIQEIEGVKSFGYSSNFRFVNGALMLANDVEIHSFAPESSGGGNMFIGKNAGNKTMNGTAWRSSYNIGIGMGALRSLVTGFTNFGLGGSALYRCTDGYYNVGVGDSSLYNLTTGYQNTAMGTGSGRGITTGYNNIAIGHGSLQMCSTGIDNTAIGNFALNYFTGSYSTAIGKEALQSNVSGEYNTAIGYNALYAATSGNNTAIGNFALDKVVGGGYNTAIGTLAGRYYYGGVSNFNTTGENGTFIGYDTRAQSNGGTNEVVIGYAAMGNGSNTVTLGNDSITKTILKGSVGVGYTGISNTFNAALTVRGAGTTTGKTLSLKNSTNTDIFNVFDNGYVCLGNYTPVNTFQIGPNLGYSNNLFTVSNNAAIFVIRGSGYNINLYSGENLSFFTGFTERMIISTSGIGIGINTPVKRLDVSDATGQCARFRYDGSPTIKADFTLDYLGNLTIASAGRTNIASDLNTTGFIYQNGTQILRGQQEAVADATNSTDVVTQFNLLLKKVRNHGLIATA